MRAWHWSMMMVAMVATTSLAQAQSRKLTDTPLSTGILMGFSTITYDGAGTFAAFSMEMPVEYTFKAGPGDVALHFGLMLNAGKGGMVSLALPMGARYKIRLMHGTPLYAYPLLDLGPVLDPKAGTASGLLRVGGGLSYLVHKNVELLFQPLGLGAVFNADGGAFIFNFLTGAQFRF